MKNEWVLIFLINSMKKIFKILGKMVVSVIIFMLVVAGGVFAFTKIDPVFGADPDLNSEKIKNSKNHNGKVFVNLEDTNVSRVHKDHLKPKDEPKGLMALLFPQKGKNPQKVLPSVKLDQKLLVEDSFVWLGHSTLMMNISGKKVLVDPVFFKASPVSFFGKPFKVEHPTMVDDVSEVDVVIISHDHYDHLDAKAIKALNDKVAHFWVPLGIGSHLQKWGVSADKIKEFDWYEGASLDDVKLTLAPSRHFSGRGLTNRFATLWGGWIIEGVQTKVYVSGDGGYSEEFKKIGENYGPFDIAFLESGAYNENWAEIHMFPEQSVQAGVDVKAKVLFPVHWGKFDLALHQWTTPIKRFLAEADKQDQQVATPIIGEVFTLDDVPQTDWWNQ